MANFYSPHDAFGVSEWTKLSNELIEPFGTKHQFWKTPDAIDDLLSTDIPTAMLFFRENIAFWVGERCLLTEAYSNNFPAQVSLAFPKKSPFTEFMNYQIFKLWENGNMSTLKKEHLQLGQYCNDHEKKAKSLSMKKLTSLFSILFTGFSVSLMLIVIEHIAKRAIPTKNISQTDPEKIKNLEALDRLLRDFGVLNQHEFKMELDNILKCHFSQATLMQK